ncbi:MAG: hypothetical protein ACK56I_09995, partial [bacterium]
MAQEAGLLPVHRRGVDDEPRGVDAVDAGKVGAVGVPLPLGALRLVDGERHAPPEQHVGGDALDGAAQAGHPRPAVERRLHRHARGALDGRACARDADLRVVVDDARK